MQPGAIGADWAVAPIRSLGHNRPNGDVVTFGEAGIAAYDRPKYACIGSGRDSAR